MEIKELGHVVLYVTDLEKVANFYRDILGFREISRHWPLAAFSSGRTHHELLLIEVGGHTASDSRPKPGLYHIGLKIGETDAELKNAHEELGRSGVEIVGSSDHHVTHSLYIKDPDGNELELYVDINDSWKEDPGVILRPTGPLEIENL